MHLFYFETMWNRNLSYDQAWCLSNCSVLRWCPLAKCMWNYIHISVCDIDYFLYIRHLWKKQNKTQILDNPEVVLMKEIQLVLRPLGCVLNLVQVAMRSLWWRLCSTGNWTDCQFKIVDLGTKRASKCFPRQVSDILANFAPFIEASLGLMWLIILLLEKYADSTTGTDL